MKIKELPESERPYEKMEAYGASSLSNAELLAIIIKTGTKDESAVAIAQKILNLRENNKCDNLRFLQDITTQEFMSIKGIGKVKAIELKAVCELTKRIARPISNNLVKISNSKDIANLLIPELRYEKREIVKVVLLNNKNKIIRIVDVSLGGTNFSAIEPKDVLIEAIKVGAPRIILVHNHPSGDPKPSDADFRVTDRIYEAADVMGIELLDHVVIGDGTYESLFFRKGCVKNEIV